VNNYRKINFEKHRLTFDAQGFGYQRSNENTFIRGDRELSANAMNIIVDSLKVSQRNLNDNFILTLTNDINKLRSLDFIDTIFRKQEETINFEKADDDSKIKRNVLPAFDTLNNLIKTFVNKFNAVSNQKTLTRDLEKQIDTYEVEIYKKYSIPFACIVFTLLGAPLGYRVRKGGFGIAAGLSLLFFLLYWACLIGGEKLADRTIVSPFLGMWIANIIIGCLGLYLMLRSS
jgi:lipopolysaccharide export system permease protein